MADSEEKEQLVPIGPLKCTQILLESLQKMPDGWQIDPKGLDWFFREFIALLRTNEMPAAVDQFLGVLGVVEFHIGSPEMAQRLVDEMEQRIPASEMEWLQDRMKAQISERAAAAQRDFAKLMGPQQEGEKIPEPKEKIEFKRPKNIKG